MDFHRRDSGQQPAYGGYPPPHWQAPPPPPPQRGGGGDGNGKLMLILTLVGTVATVVSVLLAMGIGPFDLSSDSKNTPASGQPAANESVTREKFVADVNKVCSESSDNIANKLSDVDAAINGSNANLTDAQQKMRALNNSMQALMSRVKAVPQPKNTDADLRDWAQKYQHQADLINQTTEQLNSGDVQAAGATLDEVSHSEELQASAEKVQITCP
ncbi:hypothetical protein [Yinghuangia seranimata]|uniref:hypothetical protein n=1 Tax=Yinghuangia seranimata TaxID=408067 RepID=UPI00248B85C1|nr:hypothetical protein [Yinghuangia seranimata]MDI2132148.1 hypothetical protein [Yinghuangia seranimata]